MDLKINYENSKNGIILLNLFIDFKHRTLLTWKEIRFLWFL